MIEYSILDVVKGTVKKDDINLESILIDNLYNETTKKSNLIKKYMKTNRFHKNQDSVHYFIEYVKMKQNIGFFYSSPIIKWVETQNQNLL
jgi:hypothetical protein